MTRVPECSWHIRETHEDGMLTLTPAADQDLHGSCRGFWPLASRWQCQGPDPPGLNGRLSSVSRREVRRHRLDAQTSGVLVCAKSYVGGGHGQISGSRCSNREEGGPGGGWSQVRTGCDCSGVNTPWTRSAGPSLHSMHSRDHGQRIKRICQPSYPNLCIRGMFALSMDGSTMQCARSTSVSVAQLERLAASHMSSHVSSLCVFTCSSGGSGFQRTPACRILPQFWLALMCASPRGRHGRQATGRDGERGGR